MLEQNASQGIQDYQDKTLRFTSDVIRGLLWYWWNHPTKVMSTLDNVADPQHYTQVRTVGPEQRQRVRFEDIEIDVDPYSLQHQTPQSRLATLNQTIGAIAPFMGMAQQQGVMLDLKAYLQKVAKYTDDPDLTEVLTIGNPPESGPVGGGNDREVRPPSTTRNYVRHSQGGASRYGKDLGILNSLGGQAQATNGTPQPTGGLGGA
jgi:hypothetical protein